jgi:hypothetical protein
MLGNSVSKRLKVPLQSFSSTPGYLFGPFLCNCQVKLREFMEFHFEARYPDANKVFYKKCTEGYTCARLKEIKEAFKWVRTKL